MAGSAKRGGPAWYDKALFSSMRNGGNLLAGTAADIADLIPLIPQPGDVTPGLKGKHWRDVVNAGAKSAGKRIAKRTGKPEEEMTAPSALSVVRNPRKAATAATHLPGSVRSIAQTVAPKISDYFASHSPAEALVDAGQGAYNLGKTGLEMLADDPAGSAVSAMQWVPSLLQSTADLRERADQYRQDGSEAGGDIMEQLAFLPATMLAAPGVSKLASRSPSGLAVREAEQAVPGFRVQDNGDLKTVIPTHAQPQIVPEVADAPNIDAIRAIIANPEKNQPLRVAQDYTLGNYDHNMPAPKTSLEKQSGIARVFQHAQEDDPAYKHALFERYGEMYPQMMDRLGVQNADQLLERSYSALQDEAGQQFKRLPVSMQYHFGSGEYPTPSAMMRDVYGNGNLNVFRGGDRHDFLNAVDPETGLNSNEMFRAVHDYFGHALNGSTFRPGGEEAAYASHWQMLSPEARIALLAETRGQNSFVNYSPLNADILGPMRGAQHKLDERASLLRRYNGGEPYPYLLEDAKALGDPEELRAIVAKYANSPDFQFAPQKAVLLPPEYIPPDTAGGVPDYLQPLIQPKAPVDNVRGVHFSNAGPNLTELDPSFIGTGHKGREYPWIGKLGSPERTYFYTGEPGTVGMEDALLQRRGDLRSVYEGELNGLYDTVADPEGLAKLVNAYDFGSPEGVRGAQLDRLIKEYGYQGYTGKVGGKPAAASYRKTKVRKLADQAGDRKYAQGGLVS